MVGVWFGVSLAFYLLFSLPMSYIKHRKLDYVNTEQVGTTLRLTCCSMCQHVTVRCMHPVRPVRPFLCLATAGRVLSCFLSHTLFSRTAAPAFLLLRLQLSVVEVAFKDGKWVTVPHAAAATTASPPAQRSGDPSRRSPALLHSLSLGTGVAAAPSPKRLYTGTTPMFSRTTLSSAGGRQERGKPTAPLPPPST